MTTLEHKLLRESDAIKTENHTIEVTLDEMEWLLRLIKRDIKTPIKLNERGWHCCPVCDAIVSSDEFCGKCGQRINHEVKQ